MAFEESSDDYGISTPKKEGPPWVLLSVFIVTCLGAGLFFADRVGVFDPKGLPIPNLSGEIAFRVPTGTLTANAVHERSDGNTIHYIDEPTRITAAMAGTSQHIIIEIGPDFGLSSPTHAYNVLFGKELFDDCTDDTIHMQDVWFYKYSSPEFEVEKQGSFPTNNYYIAHCPVLLTASTANYPHGDETTPILAPGDLIYLSLDPAGITALEAREFAGGSPGELFPVVGYDEDGDGLVEQAGNAGQEGSYDTDEDGISDGEEITGSAAFHANTLDWQNPDTDGDGILDGIELGRPANTETGFVGDADETTTTDPANPDTDGDGFCDGPNTVTDESGTDICTGGEDMNANGMVDAGESDPNDANDPGETPEGPVCDPACTAGEKCVPDGQESSACIIACGDGVVDNGENGTADLGEECDEGRKCADGTLCTVDADCTEVTGDDQTCSHRSEICSAECTLPPIPPGPGE